MMLENVVTAIYRVFQKKVYNKMCVLFAGFVRGVDENCMSQAGEGREASLPCL